ncbi:hypothetical protein CYMTET_49552 [Cymbomonas tetramitiformis]|uniref:Uncharacterized protein n=1 Tax=Cymbomonas tetramitiformis TaxID=36881 RepID=A0AAE0BR98_9CHLO|nr:hypothetical protein CYMTET_49552 [Cymbomonas tetramitiformis]
MNYSAPPPPYEEPYDCNATDFPTENKFYPEDVLLIIELLAPEYVREDFDLLRFKLLYSAEPGQVMQNPNPPPAPPPLPSFYNRPTVRAPAPVEAVFYEEMWVWSSDLYWALIHPLFFSVTTASLLRPEQQRYDVEIMEGACAEGSVMLLRNSSVYSAIQQKVDEENGHVANLHGPLGSARSISAMKHEVDTLRGEVGPEVCPSFKKYAWYTNSSMEAVLIIPGVLALFAALGLMSLAAASWTAEVNRRTRLLQTRMEQLHRFGSIPIGNGDYVVFLPKVKEKWNGLKANKVRAGKKKLGVSEIGAEYTYFVMDPFSNFVALHSIVNARDGEASLEDLHRALRGDAFLMVALDPPVEKLVRSCWLERNTMEIHHWYLAVLLQRVYRRWKARKNQKKRDAAIAAGENPEPMAPRRSNNSHRARGSHNKRIAAQKEAEAKGEDEDMDDEPPPPPLPVVTKLADVMTSPLDVLHTFCETVLTLTQQYLLSNMDNIREHQQAIYNCVLDVSNLLASKHTVLDQVASAGEAQMHDAFVQGAASHARNMLRQLGSSEERSKALRYLVLEVAYTVPGMVSGILSEQGHVKRRRTQTPTKQERITEQVCMGIMEDVWLECEEEGYTGSNHNDQMRELAGDWRLHQAICAVLQLMMVMIMLPVSLMVVTGALAALDDDTWDNELPRLMWSVPFGILVTFLLNVLLDFWHIQVMPGKWGLRVSLVRSLLKAAVTAMLGIAVFEMTMVTLWVALACVVRPEDSTGVVTLVVCLFWVTYEKISRLRFAGNTIEVDMKQLIDNVVQSGVQFQTAVKRPVGKLLSLPPALRCIVNGEARIMATRIWSSNSGDPNLNMSYTEAMREKQALDVFEARLGDLYSAQSPETKVEAIVALKKAVNEYSSNNEVTKTLLGQMVDRQVEGMDSLQDSLENSVRMRCQKRFEEYKETFKTEKWNLAVEAEIARKVGITGSDKAARMLQTLVLYVLASALIIIGCDVLAPKGLTTALLSSLLVFIMAAVQNRLDSDRDLRWSTRIKDYLPKCIENVMDMEKAAVTGLQAIVVPGDYLPPCSLVPTVCTPIVNAGFAPGRPPIRSALKSGGGGGGGMLGGGGGGGGARRPPRKVAIDRPMTVPRAKVSIGGGGGSVPASSAPPSEVGNSLPGTPKSGMSAEGSVSRFADMESDVQSVLSGKAKDSPTPSNKQQEPSDKDSFKEEDEEEEETDNTNLKEKAVNALTSLGGSPAPAGYGTGESLYDSAPRPRREPRQYDEEEGELAELYDMLEEVRETLFQMQEEQGLLKDEQTNMMAAAAGAAATAAKEANDSAMKILEEQQNTTITLVRDIDREQKEFIRQEQTESEKRIQQMLDDRDTKETPQDLRFQEWMSTNALSRLDKQLQQLDKLQNDMDQQMKDMGEVKNEVIPPPPPEEEEEEPEGEAPIVDGEEGTSATSLSGLRKAKFLGKKLTEEQLQSLLEQQRAADEETLSRWQKLQRKLGRMHTELKARVSDGTAGINLAFLSKRTATVTPVATVAAPTDGEVPDAAATVALATPIVESAALAQAAPVRPPTAGGAGVSGGALALAGMPTSFALDAELERGLQEDKPLNEILEKIIEDHFHSLEARIAPVIANMARPQAHLDMVRTMHHDIKLAANTVTDSLGRICADDKESKSLLFMDGITAQLEGAHSKVDSVQAAVDACNAASQDVKGMLDEQKAALEVWIQQLENRFEESNANTRACAEDVKEEIKADTAHLFKKQKDTFDTQLQPLIQSAEHLAMLPDKALEIKEHLGALTEQLTEAQKVISALVVAGQRDAEAAAEAHAAALQAAHSAVSVADVKLTEFKAHFETWCPTVATEKRLEELHQRVEAGVTSVEKGIEDLSTMTDEYGDKISGQCNKLTDVTSEVKQHLNDLDAPIRRVEAQSRHDAPLIRAVHQSMQSQHTEVERLMGNFERLRKRIERGDPLHLATQLDEIRDDMNMMMRTLGMKIHANPLQKFRENMKTMKREGYVETGNDGPRKVDVDTLLAKYGQKGMIDREGLEMMLEEYTRDKSAPPPAEHLHYKAKLNASGMPGASVNTSGGTARVSHGQRLSSSSRPSSAPSRRSNNNVSTSPNSSASPYHADAFTVRGSTDLPPSGRNSGSLTSRTPPRSNLGSNTSLGDLDMINMEIQEHGDEPLMQSVQASVVGYSGTGMDQAGSGSAAASSAEPLL